MLRILTLKGIKTYIWYYIILKQKKVAGLLEKNVFRVVITDNILSNT